MEARKTNSTPGVKIDVHRETGSISFRLAVSAPRDIPSVMFREAKADEVVVHDSGARTIRIALPKKQLSRRALVLLFRKVIVLARGHRIPHIVLELAQIAALECVDVVSIADRIEMFAREAELANFEFVRYKSVPEDGWNFVREITLVVPKEQHKKMSDSIKRGKIVAYEVNRARVLANTPGGEMTPRLLLLKAEKAALGTPIKVSALAPREMRKLGMGGILGVAQGSAEEPRLIVLEYWNGLSKKDAPIVLVGKGITFDTGGLNLKPSNSIYEMHMDMSGGAAVISAIVAAAKLGVKKNIVALVPAAENMPSGSSYRPGDILRSMSGKTIEITNTDAEGRVVLADALTYAERYKPRLVVDVATLTGAAMVALGTRASAIFSKDDAIIDIVRKLGEETGDYVWPLPLWDEYQRDIQGTFGDVVNSGKSRYGGSIEGAMFLYQFAKNYPWIHIDMAPRMTAADDEHLAKGAAGAPVRLLVKLLENY